MWRAIAPVVYTVGLPIFYHLCIYAAPLSVSSSAQLLEPFKLEHGIGAVGGAIPGSGAMPELERVPGAAPSIMAQGVLGATTELEDPPGLYEKVSLIVHSYCMYVNDSTFCMVMCI